MSWLVSLRGTLGGATPAESTEIWSFGTWWTAVSGSVSKDPQDIVDDWAPAALGSGQNFLADTDVGFCDNVFITECRVYDYFNGPLAPAIAIGYAEGTGTHAGTQSVHVPFQNSLVITLDTEGRSKPRFGRFYLPPISSLPAADGLLTVSKVNQIHDAVSTFLASMDASSLIGLGQDGRLIVQSRSVGHATKTVTGLRIGRVMDTQRRRRNKEDESYQSYAYP